MTLSTPNSPTELIALNEKIDPLDLINDGLEQLSPEQVVRLTDILLQKLESFHCKIDRDQQDDNSEMNMNLWVHDSTVISQARLIFQNVSDLHNSDED